ncbi:fatty acid--CoA ligase family protein [Cytobacillus kochii]|uniref:class I adenylate-forming enzyme family protein n=1 Tax=Cytobacillus kochii TaxID=859143 RepID=UPI001CD3F746|nr:fatty acid--CoA ligase family protein [Cytobacillus kochii]MCA1028627.1 fatty acid--CoA ligase family protein [Cytobacillus kochii]
MEIFINNFKERMEEIVLKDEYNSLSFITLIRNIIYYKHYYKNLGLTGKNVILSLENSVEWIVSFLSLASINAKIIPMSSSLNIQHIEEVLPDIKVVPTLSKGIIRSFSNSSIDWNLINKNLKIDKDNVIIHITSGSTGEPKLCERTYKSLINEGFNYKSYLYITEKDHILNPLPLSHSFAFGFSLIASMVSGAKLTIMNSYNTRKLVSMIDSEKPTLVPCVPFIAENLVNLFLKETKNVSSVRTLLIGAGKVKYETRVSLLSKYGFHTSLNYGSTETGGIVTNTNMTPKNSIGKPMNNVKIKILNEDTLEEVEPRVRGEIWVKSPSIFNGYINEKSTMFNQDGYFPMGDLGYKDKDGNLFLIKRKDKTIKISGQNINLTYIEHKLSNIEGVLDCKVFVKTSPSNEFIIKALIQSVKNNEKSKMSIKKLVKRELPAYMIPHLLFVDKIPKNELGKKAVNVGGYE